MKFMITLVSVILFLVCTSLGIAILICYEDWINKDDSDD